MIGYNDMHQLAMMMREYIAELENLEKDEIIQNLKEFADSVENGELFRLQNEDECKIIRMFDEKNDMSEDVVAKYKQSDKTLKYTLRITLKHIKPAIWRKIEVPSNLNLSYLSELIMDVMGWYGGHLHQYRKGKIYYAPLEQIEDSPYGALDTFPEEDYSLEEILPEKGKTIVFEYDFGDGWEHEIKLSSSTEYKDNEKRIVRFIDGERACPPEDCGGVGGYDLICRGEIDCFDRFGLGEEEEEYDPEYFDKEEAKEICDYFNEV